MSLGDIIDFIQSLEKELVLFNLPSAESLSEELAAFFDTQNVKIMTEDTASGAPQIAVLSTADDVLERIYIEVLRRLAGDSPPTASEIGISDAEYQAVLGHLKETTFTTYDTSQMLSASREIEDRAHRVGQGTIHAGFQQWTVMSDQRAIYTDLAQQGLTVHAYGVPDGPRPDIGAGQIHGIQTDEITRTWFVVFDGGGDDSQKSALLAEERDEDTYYGAWTYDPRIVDIACEHLEQTYLPEHSHSRAES